MIPYACSSLLNCTKFEKTQMGQQFSANHYEWAYFFEKLIASNLLFVAVGRPNPDQCFGKSTLKSK